MGPKILDAVIGLLAVLAAAAVVLSFFDRTYTDAPIVLGALVTVFTAVLTYMGLSRRNGRNGGKA